MTTLTDNLVRKTPTLGSDPNHPVRFHLDGVNFRVTRDWPKYRSSMMADGVTQIRTQAMSWKQAARNHALFHGMAGVWRADDSLILFWKDAARGSIRYRTFRHASPFRANSGGALITRPEEGTDFKALIATLL